jgi:hypothetical protein
VSAAAAIERTREDELVGRVFEALLGGELEREDLSARRLTAFLGQSTIMLYHWFGSLDGFLIRVDGAGWRHLLGELSRHSAKKEGIASVMVAYVDFAFRHPTLYWLMTERPFDRARLRSEGRLRLEGVLVEAFGALLAANGVRDPAADTIPIFASLHGLASLAASGRLDLGGHARIRESARRLAAIFTAA